MTEVDEKIAYYKIATYARRYDTYEQAAELREQIDRPELPIIAYTASGKIVEKIDS